MVFRRTIGEALTLADGGIDLVEQVRQLCGLRRLLNVHVRSPSRDKQTGLLVAVV
jgi:hypothetical protein